MNTHVTEKRVLSERLMFIQACLGVMGIRVFWKTLAPEKSAIEALCSVVSFLTASKRWSKMELDSYNDGVHDRSCCLGEGRRRRKDLSHRGLYLPCSLGTVGCGSLCYLPALIEKNLASRR